MLLTILSMIIFYYYKFPLALSLNNAWVPKISNTAIMAGDIITKTNYDKQNTSRFESYPILIPPDWILKICLKDSLLLDKLHGHISDCNNYPCMFSRVIDSESMKSIASIIRNDTMNDFVRQEFKQSIHDCLVWWKLFKHFDKNANARKELGRCLFQTFSFVKIVQHKKDICISYIDKFELYKKDISHFQKCKEPVLDKVKTILIAGEER